MLSEVEYSTLGERFIKVACEGDVNAAENLLNSSPSELVNYQNKNGHTALHLCMTSRGKLSMVRMLLRRGADLEILNGYGWSCLHNACLMNSTEMLDILLEHGAMFDCSNGSGQAPLFLAAMMNKEVIVSLLLQHGSPVNLCDDYGWTPLRVATSRTPQSPVVGLLRRHGGSPLQEDEVTL